MPNLKVEIDHLQELVDGGNAPHGVSHDTMVAINRVREMGNIGTHIGKDISGCIPILLAVVVRGHYGAIDTPQK